MKNQSNTKKYVSNTKNYFPPQIKNDTTTQLEKVPPAHVQQVYLSWVCPSVRAEKGIQSKRVFTRRNVLVFIKGKLRLHTNSYLHKRLWNFFKEQSCLFFCGSVRSKRGIQSNRVYRSYEIHTLVSTSFSFEMHFLYVGYRIFSLLKLPKKNFSQVSPNTYSYVWKNSE